MALCLRPSPSLGDGEESSELPEKHGTSGDDYSVESIPRRLFRSVSTKLRTWRQVHAVIGREPFASSPPAYGAISGCACFARPPGTVVGRSFNDVVADEFVDSNMNCANVEVYCNAKLQHMWPEHAFRCDVHSAEHHYKGQVCSSNSCQAANHKIELFQQPRMVTMTPAEWESKFVNDDGARRWDCGCFTNGRCLSLSSKQIARNVLRGLQQHSPALPDDLLEICLARLPFIMLVRTRLVSRKWKELTMSPHFLANRERAASKEPWLLIFGLSREGVSTGEIHARDPTSDCWHSIQAESLSGRYLFSVASLNGLIYVIGGCSNSATCHGSHNRSPVKTHKSVLVYNAVSGSWIKVCSMGIARALPVVAAFEMEVCHEHVDHDFLSDCQKGLVCGCCDRTTFAELSFGQEKQSFKLCCENNSQSSSWLEMQAVSAGEGHIKHAPFCGLIVVGGQGIWNQPLYSAEIYDCFSDKWKEIAKVPVNIGITCAGTICNGYFYAYSEIDKLARYDFKTDMWTCIEVCNPLARLREYIPKFVSCNGRIFVLGVAWSFRERGNASVTTRDNGIDKATRILWEFNPSSNTWQQISRHPDAPLDWNVIFVSEGKCIYGVEMFKIFGQVLDFVTVCDLSRTDVTWSRLSRIRIGNDLEVSSCITKTAAVVHL